MNKVYILLSIILFSYCIGCKSNTLQSPQKDPSTIEAEDTYIPWWAK